MCNAAILFTGTVACELSQHSAQFLMICNRLASILEKGVEEGDGGINYPTDIVGLGTGIKAKISQYIREY